MLSDVSDPNYTGGNTQLVTDDFVLQVNQGQDGALEIIIIDQVTGESSTIQVGALISN